MVDTVLLLHFHFCIEVVVLLENGLLRLLGFPCAIDLGTSLVVYATLTVNLHW